MSITLSQKKIVAFGVFFIFFILQVCFNINALLGLHVSHHVIEEEWDELNRVQTLEDLLDEQSVILRAASDGKDIRSAPEIGRLADISKILDGLNAEYGVHHGPTRTEHERKEDAYLADITRPLRAYLDEYGAALSGRYLSASMARDYLKRLTQIRGVTLLLRQTDAAFAQKALDQAKNARKRTLRDSLIISVILFTALAVWAVYFLVNLNRQTQLEIFQQKIMTAGLLAQSLAHEIRNPLGVIKSAADLLSRRQGLDKESQELAGYMVEEVQRIDSLIKELLSLSRKKSESREDADIGQIIRSVLDLIGGKLKQAKVTAHFTNRAGGILCHCVPGQIRQIVLNLLLNAIDVSPPQASIEIFTENKDNAYVLRVRDHGKGFSIKDKEKIFDLFYTTKESGFGIGLAVVKRIVNEHGGTIQVQSSAVQGSTFIVSIPLR
jgi:signal transduction histidine kinase